MIDRSRIRRSTLMQRIGWAMALVVGVLLIALAGFALRGGI
ncbi:hypothetical protein [Roseovarius sp.]|jgi:hypothetical protein